MANTFTKIASVTVGSGGASTVTFSSIPQTYTDLCIKISARTDRNAYSTSFTTGKFNSSTTSYSIKNLAQQAANSPISQSYASPTIANMLWGYTNQTNNNANTFSNTEIYIPNYTSSNYKSVSSDSVQEANDTTNNNMWLLAGLWSNTGAITQIDIGADDTSSSYNFLQYSTFTLYGIKNS